jgi:cytochrome oxidase Cu insertion factor (SCO1/SenC/PrrC family)
MTRRTLMILALMAVVGMAGLGLVFQRLPGELQQPAITTANTIQLGGAFTLVAHTGETVSDTDFQGKYLLVFFGYTFCPDVCPTSLQEMAMTLDALGSEAAMVQPLFITIDPQRDTPEVLAEYVAAFDARIIGLTGTPEQIAAVAKAYRAYYARSDTASGGDTYLMDHSAFIYLMGPDGRFLKALSHREPAAEIVKTIRSYL